MLAALLKSKIHGLTFIAERCQISGYDIERVLSPKQVDSHKFFGKLISLKDNHISEIDENLVFWCEDSVVAVNSDVEIQNTDAANITTGSKLIDDSYPRTSSDMFANSQGWSMIDFRGNPLSVIDAAKLPHKNRYIKA